MVEKSVPVYRLYNRENDYLDPDLSEEKYKLGSISFSFVEGEEYIPYITLENLSGLYGRFYKNKENTKSTVSDDQGKFTWKVALSDKDVFVSTIDAKEKTFTYSGSLEEVLDGKKDYDKYSLMMRTKVDNSTISLPNAKPYLISFADAEFNIVEEGGKTYFPFSMMHTLYHELTGRDFFYNYTYLYEYNEVEDLSKANITEGEKVYTPFEQMRDYIDEHVKEKDVSNKPLMPLYLRKYHRAEFTLVMNHFYGLRSTLGISNMTDYFNIYGIYDKLIDANSAVRGAAFSQAFFMLSDSHTGRIILGDDPWTESNGNADINPATNSALQEERNLVGTALTAQRNDFLKANGFNDGIKNAVVYSVDGKTAYFGFDSFDAHNDAKNKDGTPKSDDYLADYDSYFYFVKQLKAIKEHKTIVDQKEVKVENVIIDDSLNGGGYMVVMGRLLALISKDNNGVIDSMSEYTNVVTRQVHHVDTNNDGKYDEQDVYGNSFKFFILTSPKSFSCGNAFPIYAQKYDHVKIIGTKSGGGECVVGQNYFSNGMGFAHSSNEHVILFDQKKMTYTGVEGGVSVDGGLKYSEFYNMDAMTKCIASLVK